MDVRELLQSHDGGADLSGAILSALAGAGVDTEHLAAEDLYPVDQLHARRARDQISSVTTAGESAPFEDGALEAALMVHVGMNIPGKTVVFARVHRVLAPGARFVMFEQMRLPKGDPTYPQP